jgi:hypothetical protein
LAITVEQVVALAPDPAATAAARKLATSRAWRGLGASDEAIWGECQGSALYQVRFARDDLVSKCSCPSRKFPCKHALGLMLLSIGQQIPVREEPDWVREWLRNQSPRREKARKPAGSPDPEAQAKRAERRLERVRAGFDLLDLWSEDLVRDGIASLEERPGTFFGQMAARLVDAQASGLARRVRRIGFLAGSGPAWPRAVLDELGLAALASQAFRRVDDLDGPLRADLRQLVGFSLDKEDVIAAGDRVDDAWVVVGQTVTEDERFRSLRTWLRGITSGRCALVLQFAPGEAAFAETFVPGSTFTAALAFWPGAFPQRALVQEWGDALEAAATRLPGFDDVAGFLDSAASAYARQPFLERLCCTLREVSPIREPSGFALVPGALRTAASTTGCSSRCPRGRPVDLAGEWNGHALSSAERRGGRSLPRVGMSDRPMRSFCTALLGIGRQSAPPADARLEALLPQDPLTGERRVLLLAGIDAVRRRAGYRAAQRAQPPRAPDETRPACSKKVAKVLEPLVGAEDETLLTEAAGLLARAGQRVRPELLLSVLSNISGAELREAFRPLLGERGAWLSQFRADWSWAAPPAVTKLDSARAKEIWAEGSYPERLALIWQLRAEDPAAARSLLES